MQFLFKILIIGCIALTAQAEDYLSSHLYQLDEELAPYAIVVEKSTHQLMLYKVSRENPVLVKTFKIATGKKKGLKQVEGDKKTPEGMYQIISYLNREQLEDMYGAETSKIYGKGAFPLNFPNTIDKLKNRRGSGIWIHSTDDDSRVDSGLDSRGCVVLTAKDFSELSEYISINKTPVILTENHYFIKKKNYKKNKKTLIKFFEKWSMAWKNKDIDTYIQHYSKDFEDRRKGRYAQYKAYKRRIFRKKDIPIINFSNLVILFDKDYVIMKAKQDYRSQFINDIGLKELILKKDKDYNWKIIRERWYKL